MSTVATNPHLVSCTRDGFQLCQRQAAANGRLHPLPEDVCNAMVTLASATNDLAVHVLQTMGVLCYVHKLTPNADAFSYSITRVPQTSGDGDVREPRDPRFRGAFSHPGLVFVAVQEAHTANPKILDRAPESKREQIVEANEIVYRYNRDAAGDQETIFYAEPPSRAEEA